MTEDRHYRMPLVLKDEDDLNPSNLSAGASFQEIADIRFSRRTALKGLLATSAGDPKDAAQGAKYGGAVSDSGWFANPDNSPSIPRGGCGSRQTASRISASMTASGRRTRKARAAAFAFSDSDRRFFA
jgi:hypothetical protein